MIASTWAPFALLALTGFVTGAQVQKPSSSTGGQPLGSSVQWYKRGEIQLPADSALPPVFDPATKAEAPMNDQLVLNGLLKQRGWLSSDGAKGSAPEGVVDPRTYAVALVDQSSGPSSSPKGSFNRVQIALNKACFLSAETTNNAQFVLHLDDQNNMLHMEHYAGNPTISCPTGSAPSALVDPSEVEYSSTVAVIRPTPGPTPHLYRRMAVDGKGDQPKEEDNRSFIAKYWYIIVPLLIMSLMGGGGAPEEGSSEGQAQPAANQGAAARGSHQ
ncbi:hypothetical protein BJ085DRAFT_31398 [Dimargaris cristalligena]|uniref:Uncharacterized protein n=1 Tax=Dimargaris cristalligena TaxID=215637 RepID=A0A4P9ZNW5_9FUNG|nr:hypothetical protein BJ085DRAFT_31398 [Dimargaris cristalligena]|eukprot:RKP35124.1 hypothetical protein BJ085DRAFT_31398 [Dimargaris cristalligena]